MCKSAMLRKDKQRDVSCQIGEKRKKAMDKLVNSVLKKSKCFVKYVTE